MKRSIDYIGQVLERFYQHHDPKAAIYEDPIEFPHRYQRSEDIEIAGFVASALAFGRVTSCKPIIQRILDLSEGDPYRFVMEFEPRRDLKCFQSLYYRIWTGRDLACLFYVTQFLLRQHGSLGSLFSHCYQRAGGEIEKSLSQFVGEVFKIDPTPIYGKNSYPQSFIHLLPSPIRGSACKRLNLYLRWMVRSGDGVDFGLWSEISPAKLIIPLDAHIIRITRYLGFHHRRTPDWKMAEEITSNLRRIDPHDPVKYDFALCHLGVSEGCPLLPSLSKCQRCELQTICSRFKRLNRRSLAIP